MFFYLYIYMLKFKGNTNGGGVTRQTLKTITAVRYVRITPETWFGHVCLRVELYGCDSGTHIVLCKYHNMFLIEHDLVTCVLE